MGKVITALFFLMPLTWVLSLVFNSSSIIQYIKTIIAFLFISSVYLINPILNYIKSDDKKFKQLFLPILFTTYIIVFSIYTSNGNVILLLILCVLTLLLVLKHINSNKKITISNVFSILTLIILIVTYFTIIA